MKNLSSEELCHIALGTSSSDPCSPGAFGNAISQGAEAGAKYAYSAAKQNNNPYADKAAGAGTFYGGLSGAIQQAGACKSYMSGGSGSVGGGGSGSSMSGASGPGVPASGSNSGLPANDPYALLEA